MPNARRKGALAPLRRALITIVYGRFRIISTAIAPIIATPSTDTPSHGNSCPYVTVVLLVLWLSACVFAELEADALLFALLDAEALAVFFCSLLLAF